MLHLVVLVAGATWACTATDGPAAGAPAAEPRGGAGDDDAARDGGEDEASASEPNGPAGRADGAAPVAGQPGPDSATGDATAPTDAEWRFAGAESYSARRLRGVIVDERHDLERGVPGPAVADDAAWVLETFYRREGFAFARVESRYLVEPGGRAVVTLTVREGPRVAVGAVSFTGNEVFTSEQLRAWLPGPWFSESAVADAADAIVSDYRGRGYLGVAVDPEIRFSEDRSTADVVMAIDEGPAFAVRDAELHVAPGPDEVPAELAARLEAEVAELVGEPYVPRLRAVARSRLTGYLLDGGFADAQVAVTHAEDTTSGAVDLRFDVDAGVAVVVGQVRVSGLRLTDEDFVRERVALAEGELWTEAAERRSLRDLYRTALFSSVRVELEEGDGPRRDVLVEVEESEPIEVYVEPGYGSWEGPRIKAGARHRNVAGQGLSLGGDVSLSNKVQRGTVTLTDPWFGEDLAGSLSTFYDRRIEPAFTRRDLGFGATLTRTWTDDLSTILGYSLRRRDVSDVNALSVDASGQDPSGATIEENDESLDLGSISLIPLYDTRDQIFMPTSGMRTKGLLEWGDGSLGSDVDFLRVRYEVEGFTPLDEDTVLALAFQTGVIVPLGDQGFIPISERFFNGGQDTVRSFQEAELGPKDGDDDPLGGEAYTVASIELRRRLKGALSGAVFYDVGNVVSVYQDYTHFDDFRSGIGVGLRYLLPVGALRLDAAYNPSPRQGEDDVVVHLAVGMPF